MKRIPQRQLRNESGAVLRAVEAGEEFVITVDGRPVALLAPFSRRRFVPAATVRDILLRNRPTTLLRDVREATRDGELDPWARRKT